MYGGLSYQTLLLLNQEGLEDVEKQRIGGSLTFAYVFGFGIPTLTVPANEISETTLSFIFTLQLGYEYYFSRIQMENLFVTTLLGFRFLLGTGGVVELNGSLGLGYKLDFKL